MVILIQETLFHGLANGLLLHDRGAESLVQRFRRPRCQGRVHLALFLSPGDFERLVREEHGFGGGAEVGDVSLHFEEARGELLVDLDEGFEVLLASSVRGVLGGEGRYKTWIFQD